MKFQKIARLVFVIIAVIIIAFVSLFIIFDSATEMSFKVIAVSTMLWIVSIYGGIRFFSSKGGSTDNIIKLVLAVAICTVIWVIITFILIKILG